MSEDGATSQKVRPPSWHCMKKKLKCEKGMKAANGETVEFEWAQTESF